MQTRLSNNGRLIKNYLKNKTFQRAFIGILTIMLAFVLIQNGAVPRKYKLGMDKPSGYDITAPRDIENTLLTEKMAKTEADKVPPVMTRLENIPIDVINTADEFMNEISKARDSVEKRLQDQGITKNSEDYKQVLETEQEEASKQLEVKLAQYDVTLSGEQVRYLVKKAKDEEVDQFDKLTRSLISAVMKEEITAENLSEKVDYVQGEFQNSILNQDFKNIGNIMIKGLLKPNSIIDTEMTDQKKAEAYNTALESKQIIPAGSRIISFGDIVTEDKLQVLRELNLLESGKPDYPFSGGILAITLILALMLVLFLQFFLNKILSNRKDLLLLCFIILLALTAAWLINPFEPLLIPVFIAPMLITILLDLRLGLFVNFLLALAISLITKGNLGFIYTTIIGGTLSAFIVSGANQRSRLSASGLLIGVVNAVVIACFDLIEKNSAAATARDAALVAVNGILSTIFTIGILPFFESIFNVITPLKLLELANPNQPLIKKLLMEAPGTYHHSLMVGNLSEVATEAINGNALLARVGAYYHDVGKLKRPNFFKENQLSDNPHDKMTPNLSTLVITSHTVDGAEIADKYKIPMVVRDIISQHHGTTLAAYFYYKAKKGEKADTVKQEDFRYQGPRPSTKEAAVVMLADSVEAAVRSMPEKTEGKMEGLIRTIIKDKLDDGQLDLCELTLRDLDMIAKAFMRVFGGYFHEREEYPDMKKKKLKKEKEASKSETEDNITSEPVLDSETEKEPGDKADKTEKGLDCDIGKGTNLNSGKELHPEADNESCDKTEKKQLFEAANG